MNCDDIEGLLAVESVGELSDFERRQLDGHLAHCQTCREARLQVQAATKAMRSVPQMAPPADLAQRTVAALAAERAVKPGWKLALQQFFDRLQNLQATPARGALAAAFGVLLFMGLMTIEPHRPARPAAGGRLTCPANIQILQNAIQHFRDDHQGRPPSELGELIPQYLMAVPSCPQAGFDTYSVGYRLQPHDAQHPYTLECHGEHHQPQPVSR